MGKIATGSSEPESFDEVMRSLQRSIGAIVDSPALNIVNVIGQTVDDMMKSRQAMFLDIVGSMPKITLPSSILYLPSLPPVDTKVSSKIELVGGSNVTVEGTVTPSAKQKPQRQKKEFGLYFIAGNSVQFKRKTLKAFSLETQHGQLLKMFIEADGHYVSDKELLKAFKKIVIADMSHILRNLKNAFKANGLQPIIDRRPNSKGYVLVDIQELQ